MKYMLLSLLAVATLATAATMVQQGGWSDGTGVLWQCADGMSGTVKVLFVTKEGVPYEAELTCGQSV